MPNTQSTGSDASDPQPASVFRRLLRAFEPAVVGRAAYTGRRNCDADAVVPEEALRFDAGVARIDLISQAAIKVRHRPVVTGLLSAPVNLVLASEQPRCFSGLKKVSPTASECPQVSRAELTVQSPPIASADAALALAQPRTVRGGIESYAAKVSARVTGLLLEAVCRKNGPSNAALSVARPRITTAPDAGRASMLLTRRKVLGLNDASFIVEQRALADSAGISMAEIQWIGLFRLVPLAATQALKVDEKRGHISILLKPNSAELLKRSRQCVVNLAIGRNKVSGAIVQALIS